MQGECFFAGDCLYLG